MKISFDINKLPHLSNISMRGGMVKSPYADRAPWVDGTSAPKLNAGPETDTYVPMRSNITKFCWTWVDIPQVKEEKMTTSKLMDMKDKLFFKDSPSPSEAQTELDDAVDYWYATFKKPGNACEFAAMCLRNQNESAVANRLVERASQNLDYKIDFDEIGHKGSYYQTEEDVKLGALFEYFNSETDSEERYGIKRPAYIRTESEYLEALKEDEHPDYASEKERIERKINREELTKEDVRDAWANAKETPAEIYKKIAAEEEQNRQNRVTRIRARRAPEEEFDTAALSILKTNHPRMIGNQYTDDGIGIRDIPRPPDDKDEEDIEDKKLQLQYEREYERAKARYEAWQKKPFKYRITHKDERPPEPVLQFTPKQLKLINQEPVYYPSDDIMPGVAWYDLDLL